MALSLRMAALAILAAVAAALPASAVAGETVTAGDVELERRILPVPAGGCLAVWWVIVDDLPDVAEYSVLLRRTSPSPAERTEPFNRFTLNNIWAGTAYDYPAPAGKLHKQAFQASSSPLCSVELFQVWEAVSARVTQFTVDPPVPGKAAIELDLVQKGDGCEAVMRLSVPRVATAKEYRVQYETDLASGRTTTRLTLAPSAFNSSPRLPAGFAPYRRSGRLGHYIRSATGARGCTELAWRQLSSGVAPVVQSSASFSVTTAACFGRQPTIIAVPGRTTRGTRGADVILGTPGPDVIRGLGGGDRVCGLGGNDRVFGDGGDDQLDGGPGRDVLAGGPGRDRCVAGRGDTVRSCER